MFERGEYTGGDLPLRQRLAGKTISDLGAFDLRV
jgi:hypothetical protein